MDMRDIVLASLISGGSGGGGGGGTSPVIEMTGLLDNVSQRANAEKCIAERQAGHVVIFNNSSGGTLRLTEAKEVAGQLVVVFSVTAYRKQGSTFEYGETTLSYSNVAYNNETDRFEQVGTYMVFPPFFQEGTPSENSGIVYRNDEGERPFAYVNFPGKFLPPHGTSDDGRILGVDSLDGVTYAQWMRLYPPYLINIGDHARIAGAVNKAVKLFATGQGDAFYEKWSDSDKEIESLITTIGTKNKYLQRYDMVKLGGIEGSVLSASSNTAILEFAAVDSSTNLIGKMLMRLSSDNSAGEGNETAIIYIRIDASIAKPFPQT